MANDPAELTALETHEKDLIRLMKGSIDTIKLHLHSQGMIPELNIEEGREILSTKKRMQKVLEFVLTQMKKESNEKSKKTYDHFLHALDEELAWENLKKDLEKSSSKLAEEWEKKSKQGKPWVDVFRKNMPKMTELLRTSVVRFPGLLAAHGIHLDEDTTELAINPKPDTAVTVIVLDEVKAKVQDDPEECFKEFIECLQQVDDLFFGNIIKKVEKEKDLEQAKKQLEEAKKKSEAAKTEQFEEEKKQSEAAKQQLEEERKKLEAAKKQLEEEKKKLEAAKKESEVAEEDRCMKDADEMMERLEKVQ